MNKAQQKKFTSLYQQHVNALRRQGKAYAPCSRPLPCTYVLVGKGKKDRFVILPKQVLMTLRKYWSTHRYPSSLFPAGKTAEDRHPAHHAPLLRSSFGGNRG